MQSFPSYLRRRDLVKLAGLPLLGAAGVRAQDKFPSRPIRIVVPFPAGASNDLVGRTIGQKMGELLGATIVVENRTGASGNIGADFVAQAPADGYTLLVAAVSVVTNPALMAKPAYVPAQLTPLGVGIDAQLVLVARPGFPARDLAGLIKAAQDKPGTVNAASPGVATLPHLGIELLTTETKAKFNHIPYRGSAPALADIMGGQADFMIDTFASAGPFIAAGKLQAIAALTPRRIASLPSVPTAGEQGFKSLEFSAWNTFMTTAGTPPAVVQALNEALAKAIQSPEVTKSLQERGLEPVVQTPAAYLDFVQRETLRWSKVIKDANVKI